MTLPKADITQQVYKTYSPLTMAQSQEVVEMFLSIAKAAMISGNDLLLSGFGKFNVKDKKSQRGRNPQTGESLELGARRMVTFKPSSLLRARVNWEQGRSEGKTMYRRYELPPELGGPYLYKGGKSSGMATDPPQVGDMATFRVGGLAVFDLVVEAIGDVTVKGEVAGFQGYFTDAFPRTFDRGDKLEVDKAAAFIFRRIGEYVRS